MPGRSVAVGLVALATLLAACESIPGLPPDVPRACTEIGCENLLSFVLTDVDLVAGTDYAVQVCLEDDCEQATLQVPEEPGVVGASAGRLALDVEGDVVTLRELGGELSGSYAVSFEVRDSAGQQLVATQGETRFQRSQPNGDGCPPICWQARIEV